MPHTSKRKTHLLNANKIRWSNASKDTSSDESSCSMDMSDGSGYSMDISDEDDGGANYLNFKDTIQLCDIADIFELCKNQCNIRYLTVLVYLILRRFNISFQETNTFLKDIGGLTGEVAHKWSKLFTQGKFDEFVIDGRGGKRGDSFYDVYPELETEAKAFAVLQCEQKASSFTTYDLAHFIDKRYYEINNSNKTDSDLVRSVGSCRLDLRQWGARFDTNTNRPYFQGHDRPDVLAHRDQFIHHFLSNKDSYYTVTEGENAHWKIPTKPDRTILICKTSNLMPIYTIIFFDVS